MKANYVLKEELLNLCGKIYGPKEISKESIDIGENIEQIIRFARRNRLAHYLALESAELSAGDKDRDHTREALISEYNDYEKNLIDAIREVKDVSGEEPFIVVKTFSAFPHLTHDLDVVVKDAKTAEKISGRKSLLPVDVNTAISWGGADAVSNDFVWNNVRKFTFAGIDFFVPNHALDALIRIGHLPFEVAQIRLGELLHIYRQLSSFDWTILKSEAELMGWPRTFNKMVDVLEMLHYKLFDASLFRKKAVPVSYADNVEFPFRLPIGILAGGVIEKRAWKKIFGARFILKDWITEWVQKDIS